MRALGLEFCSAAQLSKRPGSVWNCLWEHALKRSPGIIRKSRVSYPGPGFLSSATWPSLPKKHYNGLKNKLSNISLQGKMTRSSAVQIFKLKSWIGIKMIFFFRLYIMLHSVSNYWLYHHGKTTNTIRTKARLAPGNQMGPGKSSHIVRTMSGNNQVISTARWTPQTGWWSRGLGWGRGCYTKDCGFNEILRLLIKIMYHYT